MQIELKLQEWLDSHPAPWKMGQVLITREENSFFLQHGDDQANLSELETSADYKLARQLVIADAEGHYRPVKGMNNLKAGWRIGPLSLSELRLTLDIIYPTCVANFLEDQDGGLRVTNFRQTAERQTGMYAIVKTISDDQLGEVEEELCARHCLRSRLWCGQRHEVGSSEIPLLCPEVCSPMIAAARAKVKGKSHDHSHGHDH